MAFSPKEAFVIARKFGSHYERGFFVKAQVQTIARSKGEFRENGFKSGIHKVKSIDDVQKVAEMCIGNHFVNRNTQPAGIICPAVLVMEDVSF